MLHRILLAAGRLSAEAAASRLECDADLLPAPEEESFVMCSSTQLGLRMRLSKAATKFLWKRRFSVDGSPAVAMQSLMLLHFINHEAIMQSCLLPLGRWAHHILGSGASDLLHLSLGLLSGEHHLQCSALAVYMAVRCAYEKTHPLFAAS